MMIYEKAPLVAFPRVGDGDEGEAFLWHLFLTKKRYVLMPGSYRDAVGLHRAGCGSRGAPKKRIPLSKGGTWYVGVLSKVHFSLWRRKEEGSKKESWIPFLRSNRFVSWQSPTALVLENLTKKARTDI